MLGSNNPLTQIFRTTMLSLGQPHVNYTANKNELFKSRSHVDRGLNPVVAQVLCHLVLDFAHHPPVIGRPGKRKIYDTQSCNFDWQYLANKV